MHIDDRLRLLQATLKTLVLSTELLVLREKSLVRILLSSPLLRRETLELASISLLSPFDDVGRVDSLAAEKSTKLSVLLAGIGLTNDSQLVAR